MNVSLAFHDGGVGPCEGCHNMHGPVGGVTNRWLLQRTDTSSSCLNCHSGAGVQNIYHVSSPDGSAMTPGGDFYWLKQNFFWNGGSSLGDSHGHNITAWDYGFTQDTRLAVGPGGTYESYDLGCTSCHDPHGRTSSGAPVKGSGSYGATPNPGSVLGHYRLLGGVGYNGGAHVLGYYFYNNAPVARQNPAVPYGESDTSHVDYGSGMSEWCGNCHAGILNTNHEINQSGFEHPVGNNAPLEDYVDNYNLYIRTGDLSGNIATSYLALVPFERGVIDPGLLDPTSTQGPNTLSNIMCLTCHRAHASAFPNIGRWDFTAQLVADSHPAVGDVGATVMNVYYSYYARDMINQFGPGQRILCEKCHAVPKSGYPSGW